MCVEKDKRDLAYYHPTIAASHNAAAPGRLVRGNKAIQYQDHDAPSFIAIYRVRQHG